MNCKTIVSLIAKLAFQAALLSLIAGCKFEADSNPNTDIRLEQSAPKAIADNSHLVIKIVDGDTFDILNEGTPMRIRIFGIDAPERGMPFYKASKKHLSELIFGKYVSVQIIENDRYGRAVCRVTIGSDDLSEKMVGQGMAWHFKRYSNDSALSTLENEARNAKLGLWRDEHPIAPWDVRKAKRKRRVSTPAAQ